MRFEQFLPHYHKIVTGKHMPIFQQTKYLPVSFQKSDSTNTLWRIHNDAIKLKTNLNKIEKRPKQSLLDLKIELASRMYQSCCFCEHRCQINREDKIGFCRIQESFIASAFTHTGEEKILIPSYTIFFSGCNFKCIFCQNHDISQHPRIGLKVQNFDINQTIKKNQKEIQNINWVGGEPTPHLKSILQLIKKIEYPIAQIWNSNMFCSYETMLLLDGVIDLYLTDLKFGNNDCAEQLCKVQNYWDVVTRNHQIASNNKDVLIRHLLLPDHIECCSKQIIDWAAHNLDQYMLHIMNHYYPSFQSKQKDGMNRIVSQEEYKMVLDYAIKKHIILYE